MEKGICKLREGSCDAQLMLEMENIVSIVNRGDLVDVDAFLTHSQSAAVLHVVDRACSEFSTEVDVALLKICIKWWEGDGSVDMKRHVLELEEEEVMKGLQEEAAFLLQRGNLVSAEKKWKDVEALLGKLPRKLLRERQIEVGNELRILRLLQEEEEEVDLDKKAVLFRSLLTHAFSNNLHLEEVEGRKKERTLFLQTLLRDARERLEKGKIGGKVLC